MPKHEPATLDHMLCSEANITEDLQEEIQAHHCDRAQGNPLYFRAHSLHQKHHLHQKPIVQAAHRYSLAPLPFVQMCNTANKQG